MIIHILMQMHNFSPRNYLCILFSLYNPALPIKCFFSVFQQRRIILCSWSDINIMTGAFLPKSDGSERKWKCVSKDLSGSVSQGKFRPQTLQRSKLFLLSEQLRCHQSSAHWVMVQQAAVITYNSKFPQCNLIFVVSPLCLNFWLFPLQTQAGWWRRVTYEKAVWLMFQISSMKMEVKL